MRPSSGASRFTARPFHAASAAFVEPYFVEVTELRFEQAQLRVGNILLVEGPEEERVFVLQLDAEHGRLIDQRFAGLGIRRREQRSQPRAMLFLEGGIKEQSGERVLVPVIAIEPRQARARRKPQRKIDREVRVNSLGFHGSDDFLSVPDSGQVGLTVFVEHRAMDAHQVDAIRGEKPRTAAECLAGQLVRGTVDGPEAHRLTVPGVNISPVPRRDDAVFAGECFVQTPQVDGAVCRDRVGRGFEIEPVPVLCGLNGSGDQKECDQNRQDLQIRWVPFVVWIGSSMRPPYPEV
jgi:hypothetical protein